MIINDDLSGKRSIFLNGTAICTKQKDSALVPRRRVLSALCKLPVNVLKQSFCRSYQII